MTWRYSFIQSFLKKKRTWTTHSERRERPRRSPWNIWVHRNKVVQEGILELEPPEEKNKRVTLVLTRVRSTTGHNVFIGWYRRNSLPQRHSEATYGPIHSEAITSALIWTKDRSVSKIFGGKQNKVDWEAKPIQDDIIVLRNLFQYIDVCNENHGELKWASKEALRRLGNP
ncbi:hypothetical protein PVK06_032488 [Gossypium arboreum]|uniref:Uncharacterized protein n=1 Tax=Gossypium arboreum TaxID=29729 RepID=A0ABR0NTY6_GOSAR|nr:hypothetical protein PVK06_032488 [Gossypium arboreum]